MNSHVSRIGVNLSLLVLLLGAAPRLSDEEATLVDGTVLRGSMEGDPDEGLVFRSPGRAAVPVSAIRRIVHRGPARPPAGTSPAHRVLLWGNESLTGTIHGIDEGSIALELPGGSRVRLPLCVVASVEHAHGDAVLLADDFEEGESARRAGGAARTTDERSVSGRSSFRLGAAGDLLEYRLPEPIGSGWFEARFFDSGRVRPEAEWVAELEYVSPGGPRTLDVLLGWTAESYGLGTPQGPTLAVQRVARQEGWHRLAVRFGPSHTAVLLDDAVLTHAEVGLGHLQAVRLFVRGADGAPAGLAGPAGYVDDLQIAVSIGSAGPYQPAPEQDTVLLTSGDQLYGQVESASDRGVTIRGDYPAQPVPWPEIQRIHFASHACPPRALDGRRVRVTFAATALPDLADAQDDLLECVLRGVAAETIELEHPYLGVVRIARDRLRELEIVASGRWMVLDPGFHHFGDQVNIRLQAPYPEGNERSWRFALDAAPGAAVLVVHAVDMETMARGGQYHEELKNGELRTYLALNGRELEPNGLNALVPLNARGAVRLRIALPAGALREGENVLRLHQTPQKESPDSFDDCGLFGLGLVLGEQP